MNDTSSLFYFRNAFGQNVGPLSDIALRDMVNKGLIDPLTRVFREGEGLCFPVGSLTSGIDPAVGQIGSAEAKTSFSHCLWNWSGPLLGFVAIAVAGFPFVALPLAVLALILGSLSWQNWKRPGLGAASLLLPCLGVVMPLLLALAMSPAPLQKSLVSTRASVNNESSDREPTARGSHDPGSAQASAEPVRSTTDFAGTWEYAETVDGPNIQMSFHATLDLDESGSFVWTLRSGARAPGTRFPQMNQIRTEGNWSLQPDGSIVAVSSDSSGDSGSVYRMIDQDTLTTKLGGADKIYQRTLR